MRLVEEHNYECRVIHANDVVLFPSASKCVFGIAVAVVVVV